MSSRFYPSIPLIPERLVLRSWSLDDVHAVLDERRSTMWAPDFPTEGDRVLAEELLERSAWVYRHDHRLIAERRTGRFVGSIGLF